MAWRWTSRTPTKADGQDAAASNDPPAAVARVERRTISNTLKISGEFKPFQDVDVHAKVAGYIKAIYVDVGTHVKQGQTLAIRFASRPVSLSTSRRPVTTWASAPSWNSLKPNFKKPRRISPTLTPPTNTD